MTNETCPTPSGQSRDDGVTGELARMKVERDSAVDRARQLEHDLGRLRGQVKRLELIMWRRTARRKRWEGRARRIQAFVTRKRGSS